MIKNMKTCPKCHLINSININKCECGYSFFEGLSEPEKQTQYLDNIDRNITKIKNIFIAIVFITIISCLAIILILLNNS